MGKIKVGEYIRTTSGDIGKLIRVELDEIDGFLKWYVYDNKRDYEPCTNKPYITKHSPNIIDLIEVKDFIEVRIGDEVVSKFLIQDEHQLESTRIYVREGSMKILAVVTHESFNSIKYEVE